jgi:hypothetical protein
LLPVSSFIFLHTSLVCPVLESITVVQGMQLQVTVFAFSCFVTTQCSMTSALAGGSWLRTSGGAATGGGVATGWFFAAQPVKSRQTTRQHFLMPIVSLCTANLSMAILIHGCKLTKQSESRTSFRLS